MKRTELKVNLDWTPNINHIGFFVAKKLGYYKEVGIDIDILDPSVDNYQTTPAKNLELGKTDFALCPLESVISFRSKKNPINIFAIAAILQNDLSAIAVKAKNIKSPKDLDGKTYASYGARYEDLIVKQMIKNDKGKGNISISYPPKLGIWNTLLNNNYDSTWVFENWEGVDVKKIDGSLTYFRMRDYEIPYSYSPVIIAEETFAKINSDLVKNFLKATKKGYLDSINYEKKTTEILSEYIPEHEKNINLIDALKLTNGSFTSNGIWGKMDETKLKRFIDWLINHNIIDNNTIYKNLFTNRFLT